MHFASRAALAAAFLALVAASPTKAAEVTPEQAKALEVQIRMWIEDTLGPDIRVADRPVQVVPEGDHFRLSLPIRVMHGFTPDTIMLTGSAAQISGGRWAVEGLRIPSPSSFTIEVAAPNGDAAKGGRRAPGPPIPVDYTITADSQESQGVYDPGYATPSMLTTDLRNLKIVATSALADQLTTVRHLAGTNTIRPSGLDRVDFITDSTMEGYTLSAKMGDGQRVDVAAERMRANGEFTAVSQDNIATMIPALMRIIARDVPGALKPDRAAPSDSASDDSAIVRVMIQALQNLASELTLQETIDRLVVHYGAFGGTAGQLRIGMGLKSDDGLLQARMELGVDDLALPDLPLGDTAGLMPHRVALHPVLSGIPTQYLTQLMSARGNVKDAGPPPEYAALFSRGGVSAALESFSFDSGGASFAGMGAVMLNSPQQMTGQAQVTATNFDALIQRVSGSRSLAGILPALVFAKGVGRMVDNHLVWDVTYRDNKLLVNGTDLSAMMGGGKN